MNKIVFSLILAVLSMGCSDTIVIVYPEDDATMNADGGMDMPDSAQVLPDVLVTPDATVTVDAGTDAVTPDVCTGETECCHAGQPIRVGSVCGDYPASAGASCTPAGECAPTTAQQCDLVNACCDGWSPRAENYGGSCYCVPTDEWVAVGYKGCSTLPQHQGTGGGAGTCVNINMEIACAVYTPNP